MEDTTDPKRSIPKMRQQILNMCSSEVKGFTGGAPGVIWARDQCNAVQYWNSERFGKQCPHGVTSAEFTST